MEEQRLKALFIVYSHWIQDEIRRKKEQARLLSTNAFSSYIHQRKSVDMLNDMCLLYWEERPVSSFSINRELVHSIDGQTVGPCPKCKHHVLKIENILYDQYFESWTRCQSDNCAYIPMKSVIYLDFN